ncbi:MAG: presenilin family intramembrane aspartyl protease [Patescibacteria group bacterium]|nr:presenilin family intramembrane aspartyl protease [Patescibacteria group bacterium]
MNFKIRYFFTFNFIFELFLFIFTQYLALGVFFGLTKNAPAAAFPLSSSYSAWFFVLALFLATAMVILILKYVKTPRLIQIIYAVAILDGLWLFGSAYFNWPEILYFLIAILAFYFIYQNVLVHDMVIVLAISAISAVFGANLAPSQAIIILIFLAAYDFIAVYKTKHMVSMFRGLVEKKVFLSVVVPQTIGGIFKRIRDVSPQTEFMFLGTGDLAAPAIFIVACSRISLVTAFYTAIGSVAGFIFLFILFVSQKEKQPMPGLPPIILGCLLGYLFSFLK